MAKYRDEAKASYGKKLDRMGLGISTSSTGAKADGHAYPQEDGSQGKAQGGRAEGYATAAENEATLEAKAPKKLRLDRPAYANGGSVKKKAGTTVNVIVAPQGGGEPPAPPMMPPAPPPPMMKPPGAGMPPPGGGPELPGAGGPPPMMRKHGGRVPHLDGGAGGGKGRLSKIREYGDEAKP